MNPRSTWTLTLLAGALLAFIVFFERRARLPGEPSGPPQLLTQIRPSEVSTIEVQPDGQPEIQVDRTNDTWQLTKPTVCAADREAVEGFLHALDRLAPRQRLTVQDFKAGGHTLKEFGLDPPRFTITLHQANYRQQILIGKNTVFNDLVYLQADRLEGTFVVDAGVLRDIPATKDAWRSTAIVDLDHLSFDRIDVTNGGRWVMEFQRTPAGRQWFMTRPLNPARADNPKLEDLLRKLQALRATQFISDDPKTDLAPFGLQTPAHELALAQGTNTMVLLQFGATPTNNPSQLYARKSDSGNVVILPAESLAPWWGGYNEFRDKYLAAFQPAIVDEIESRLGTNESYLLRRQTNGPWRVAATETAADPARVQELLAKLGGIEIVSYAKDAVTDPTLLECGLKPPRLEFILRTSATNAPGVGTNMLVADLQFGAQSNLQAGSKSLEFVYARRTDLPEESYLYAVKRSEIEDLPAADWQFRDSRLWNFTENDVTRVIVRQPGKAPVELRRLGANQWTPTDRSGILDLALDATMRKLGEAKAVTWVTRGTNVAAAFGVTDHSAKLTVDLRSGTQCSITFGSISPSDHRIYATTQFDGLDYVFKFSRETFDFFQTYLGLAPSEP